MRTSFASLFAAALSAACLAFAVPANATVLESCGNIELGATASCEIRVEGGCTASCQPINFTAECAADLYVGCAGGCNAKIDAQCTASCQGSCEAQCNVNPGAFDCAASCRTDCEGSCDAACAAKDDAECRASCRSTCGGECDARCNATPPDADCMAQCQGCCSGSCQAEADMTCQIDCQANGYVQCRTSLQGGCETACQRPEGALFCDNQFVDVGDQLDRCVEDLKGLLQIEVKGYARGNAQCSNGSCTAEGSAGFSCAQSGGESSGSAIGFLGALAAFGLALGRRKNARV